VSTSVVSPADSIQPRERPISLILHSTRRRPSKADLNSALKHTARPTDRCEKSTKAYRMATAPAYMERIENSTNIASDRHAARHAPGPTTGGCPVFAMPFARESFHLKWTLRSLWFSMKRKASGQGHSCSLQVGELSQQMLGRRSWRCMSRV